MNEESPGHRADLAAGFAAGSRLGGYRLEEQVGAGGMAVVFRAHDERLDRLVALKIMTPAMSSDDMFRQRFIRESRAAAAVEDPHIIPVYEAGEAGHVLFIAMRLVRGGDVRSLLRREGPLPPDRVASIISPVASALDAAHAAGLVHRDVKPANILLDRRPGRPDHVYLSDFGLSKSAEVSLGLTAAGQFLGTPDYTAPEQIEGLPVDGRTDQYALACGVFELLTGQAPFHRSESFAAIWAHLNKPPPSLAERRPGLPPAADGVIAKALAKAQVDRYETCWEFADALRDALGLPAYHLSSASDPGLARPGSLPGREGTGPTPGQQAPRGAASSPAAGASPAPGAAPAPGQASPAAAAGVSVSPPGEDTEASEIYAARSPGLNWPAGQPHSGPQASTPDDQATDPGRQAIPPDPDGGQENEPSSPRQQADPPAVHAGDPVRAAVGTAAPAEQPSAPPAERPSAAPAGKPSAPPAGRAAAFPAEQPAAAQGKEAAGVQAARAPAPAPQATPSPAPQASTTPPPAPQAALTREPEAAPTPAPQPARGPASDLGGPAQGAGAPPWAPARAPDPRPAGTPGRAAGSTGRTGTPARKADAPAGPTVGTHREQPRVAARRPAPPQNWPGSPRSQPERPSQETGDPAQGAERATQATGRPRQAGRPGPARATAASAPGGLFSAYRSRHPGGGGRGGSADHDDRSFHGAFDRPPPELLGLRAPGLRDAGGEPVLRGVQPGRQDAGCRSDRRARKPARRPGRRPTASPICGMRPPGNGSRNSAPGAERRRSAPTARCWPPRAALATPARTCGR